MNHELEAIFSRYNLKGSIVIHLIDKKIQIYNPERASERFTPASTFKILNTLIALEEQAISDINDIIRWDGHFYEYPSWNGDQTLASAFKGSCVWFYQELARRIGREKYKKYFEQISFGELSEQFEETNFWLDDSLKISALEQIDFLKEVYQRTLPFSATHYDILKEIMTIEKTPAYTLFGKTGWGPIINANIGWFIGYIESKNNVHFFATNMTITDKKDLAIRRDLTMEILSIKGII